VAALIDAARAPQTPADIEARLPKVRGRTRVDAGFLKNRPCRYLSWTPDGRLASIRTGCLLDVVLTRPSWENPWEFAYRMVALEQTYRQFVADVNGWPQAFDKASVFAAGSRMPPF
jgi:hypothetical protein